MKYLLTILFFSFATNSYAEEPTYQECFQMVQDSIIDEQQAIEDEAAAVQRGEVPVEIEEEKNPFAVDDATLVFNPNAADGEKRYDLEFKNINVQDYIPQKPDENSIEGQCQDLYGLN